MQEKNPLPTIKEIRVPDLGNIADAAVIEIAVKPGDTVKADDSLITLESEKASMDVPSPAAGVVKEVKVKVGDKLASGAVILMLEVAEEASSKPADDKATKTQSAAAPAAAPVAEKPQTAAVAKAPAAVTAPTQQTFAASGDYHAGPGVRRLAREFGVDLSRVKSTGPKGRIVKEDVQVYVKTELARARESNGGFGLPAAPIVDFAQYGAIESKPLSRIKRYTATNLHRNWLLVPHVTQFEEADITELERFRKLEQLEAEKLSIKLTPLAFIMKAVVASLQEFPNFNASLDQSGENLILKKYIHIGVAVDTPEGLVVPVIRDVDQKGVFDLARELAEVSAKARKKLLTPNDMQGSSFTISSLGGIGGTAFTPIVNVPNVAILGVSKAKMKPVYQDNEFVPRLLLPLSLSYDHRVIDGAEGARFVVHLASNLADIRRVLL